MTTLEVFPAHPKNTIDHLANSYHYAVRCDPDRRSGIIDSLGFNPVNHGRFMASLLMATNRSSDNWMFIAAYEEDVAWLVATTAERPASANIGALDTEGCCKK